MDDLAQWLSAQLDEDERTARKAGDSFRQIGETGVIVATEGDRAEECASANWAGVAEHIVRHDPARVLREVEAKRRILTEHALNGWVCTTCDNGDVEQVYPCPTQRLLATVYADRPGYREVWRP
ncbi:DUF6221 family protein [Streptomyces scabiei]|uniref:DUF6221 family protein n=1 Tax=Streptomyces scabiei TaxID=1930 RepID=UPI000E68DD9D|nr:MULTISPECIES: DUF6221 family protein [Streptomyces]MDX2749629.1 DUF6221 family protein [Streptomyces scabiei]MDX3146503.1 DUF6221 family protein [Streptomyces scabiei]MDX3196909.1 DUF6221 family protein [Streptomyces scabiei]QTU50901.1 hypothetical protein F3K20_14670 [Streptomyces sp. LBUM 1482]